jgi:hypothetical protein
VERVKMKRWLILQTWHGAALLLGLGTSAVVFAWTSFNLIDVALANARLIADYGVMGLLDGGLLQLAQITLNAALALLCFLMFKGCETEIIRRWRGWHGPDSSVDI